MLLGRLAKLGGLRETDGPVTAAELAETFTWDAGRAHPDGLAVPGGFFG